MGPPRILVLIIRTKTFIMITTTKGKFKKIIVILEFSINPLSRNLSEKRFYPGGEGPYRSKTNFISRP